jgi:hypothetical protein
MFIQDPGSEFFHHGSRVKKILGNMIQDVYPGSGSSFFTHPGFRDKKSTGSRIRISQTGSNHSKTEREE